MFYDVLLERVEDNGYLARVLAWPDYVVKAPTREEALAEVQAAIRERLSKAEIVTVEIERSEASHPWLPYAGTWANYPLLDEFKAEIDRHRREIDADYRPQQSIS